MLVLAACRASVETSAQAGARTSTSSGSEATDTSDPRLRNAEQLAMRAIAAEREVTSTRRTQLSSLLTAMADVLAALPHSDAGAHALRSLQSEFDRAAPESPQMVAVLTRAAHETLKALEPNWPISNPDSLGPARQRAQDALQRISPHSGLLVQAAAVRDLTRALTDALLIASGSEPIFTEDARDAAVLPSPDRAASFEASVENARQLVLQLSQAGWRQEALAGELLHALAEALSTLESAAELRGQIAEIRFQAQRLIRHGNDFTRGAWGKRGLQAAIFALERSLAQGQRAVLAPWLETARTAVGALDDRTALGFQRARTQDAFRCAVDAFFVLAQRRSS